VERTTITRVTGPGFTLMPTIADWIMMDHRLNYMEDPCISWSGWLHKRNKKDRRMAGMLF
jgi:hypothetical protein